MTLIKLPRDGDVVEILENSTQVPRDTLQFRYKFLVLERPILFLCNSLSSASECIYIYLFRLQLIVQSDIMTGYYAETLVEIINRKAWCEDVVKHYRLGKVIIW